MPLKDYTRLIGTKFTSVEVDQPLEKEQNIEDMTPKERARFLKKYFVEKAKEKGIVLYGRNEKTEIAILENLLKEVTFDESKIVIDYLVSDEQTFKPKQQIGFYLLSTKWRQSLLPLAFAWSRGETVKPPQQKKMEREYTGKKKGVTIT